MALLNVNFITDLDIHLFSGSGITDYEAGTTNCLVHTRNGKNKLTQRPSIDVTEDASELGSPPDKDRGRGIYYWENNAKLYIVNDNDVFAETQNSTRLIESAGSFPSGSERVTILETLGTPRLVILDAQNNEGWVMSAAESLTQIASNFPSTLAHGGAVLDTYLFVMDEDGTIYNSAPADPTTFGALSFVTAERDNDKGVYLGKHHDNLFAISTKTIEFFYNGKNEVGSPLNRRNDISYNIGCASGLGVWENGDETYFLGSKLTGQIKIYKLQGFQVQPISSDTLNSYLTQGLTQSGLNVVLTGLSAMGHDILIMHVYTLTGASPGEIVPKQTIVFDTDTGFWGFWTTDAAGLSYFPLVAGTKRTGGQNDTVIARTWEGIMYNGDIVNINDQLIPIDTTGGSSGVYEAGVYELDVYVATSAATGVNIPAIIRTGGQNAGTGNYKFQQRATLLMESTPSAQTMTIKHADEGSTTFSTAGTIDTSSAQKELQRQSRFINRNYQLEYSGDEQFFIEALQVEGNIGS